MEQIRKRQHTPANQKQIPEPNPNKTTKKQTNNKPTRLATHLTEEPLFCNQENSCLVTYRDRLDIIADILNVVSREAKKTQIMYQANLSYKVLQRYLNEIAEASLVTFQDTNQIYLLTLKGHEYLDAYKEYQRCSKTMEKRLNDFSLKRKFLETLCPAKQNFLEFSK